ncbi:MAG: response regulator [Nitrospinae bacterium]|nr:response regulator [Nitrospinota bacterium]
MIKNFLTKTGFEKGNIFVAHDKNQAMMMYELEKFDLVTSGIHLKDANGIDLLREIREKDSDNKEKIPFLIISAEERETYQEKLNAHQDIQYLRKPFNQDQFEQTICRILNGTDNQEPVETKPSESASTQESSWEESPVEIPSPIVEAFTMSAIEALEQYMTEAIPEVSKGSVELNGYFSAWVDLVEADNRIQITTVINFPKEAACSIYEEIFGEVDIEQVGGVVQELANIIGGIVKPKISPFSNEITQVLPQSEESVGELDLIWDLGLPESKMGEGHSQEIKLNGMPKFHVPFKIKDDIFHLVVLIQKF